MLLSRQLETHRSVLTRNRLQSGRSRRIEVPEALLVIVAALCILPFLLSPIPEQSDTPNHIPRLHILLSHSDNLDAVYRVHWRWIGNLGVDLPALALTPLVGTEHAVAIIDAAIAPLTLFGMWLMARAAYGRFGGGAALALPLVLSQTFLWGFLNFNLSIALGLIVAAGWLRRPPQGLGLALLFGVASLIVWTAHAMGWGVLIVIVVGFELPVIIRDPRRASGRLPLMAPLLLPLLPMALWRDPGAAPLYHYDSGLLATKVMDFATLFRGVSKPLDLTLVAGLGIAAAGALIIGTCLTGASQPAPLSPPGLLRAVWRGLDPRLATAGALLLLAVLLAPTTIMDSWAADLRITPVAAIVSLMAIRPLPSVRGERILVGVGVMLFAIRLATVATSWHEQAAGHTADLALLDSAPAGGRIGFLRITGACGIPWRIGSDRHLGSYAVIRRNAFANTSFVVHGADLVTLRSPRDAAVWVDGSQEVSGARCPSGVLDPAVVAARLQAMATAFPTIWVIADRPLLTRLAEPIPGMHIVARATNSLLLAR